MWFVISYNIKAVRTLYSNNICRILAEHMNMKHGTHREEDPEDANDDHQDMIVKGF